MIRIIRDPENLLNSLVENRPHDKEVKSIKLAYPPSVEKLILWLKSNKIVIILP